jgi:branched-chain amino acid aminotransferase
VEPNARFAASPHAGTKTTSWILNLVYLEQAQARGFDEVLLLNERGEVSECASANIFAAYGTRISTPPLGAGCLPGVTRDLLLSEVRAEGIVVEERTLRPEDLEQADEVFITSVTRDLLPVFSIEGLNLRRQGDSRQRLGEAFRSYVEAYVAGHRGKGVRAV